MFLKFFYCSVFTKKTIFFQSLTIQRKMAENLAIAQAQEMEVIIHYDNIEARARPGAQSLLSE